MLFVVEALYDLPLAHHLIDFQLEIILLRVYEVRASLQPLLCKVHAYAEEEDHSSESICADRFGLELYFCV